ncbi:cupin-like domain-containing protein [Aquimarina muelleri]|uniref:JmjC domain-containing protein n=1 Tax=Aquimarina muelleri TaxID=279356 RepID=A0A918JTJ7_9FLAO|nr:cupin-like domain-containing protein [Aquimarina muelleri]MCX2761153.1 cupin-like domain-containing protein [Aquimarina muelleri]GGX08691.1 hypothetical protein GCM10007384_08050 [Aquimarina muelleri]
MGYTILEPSKEAAHAEIAVEHNISREKFYKEYVNKCKPVIIKGLMDEWPAKNIWSNQYFSNLNTDQSIVAKKGNVKKGNVEAMKLSEYVALMQAYELSGKKGKPPYYLHDFPLFQVMPELRHDIGPFPLHLFPKWYSYEWWNYICFFMGTSNNSTPMHIDTLLTNNLFFQVSGTKEFLIVLPEDMDKCYRYAWKWSKINPDKPDYEKYPKYKEAKPLRFKVSDGDILYMPSGTFHQVRSLTSSISFNIDWHTKKTVRKGLLNSITGRASFPNIYYNVLLSLGLNAKVPAKYIFPYYKSYFDFIA